MDVCRSLSVILYSDTQTDRQTDGQRHTHAHVHTYEARERHDTTQHITYAVALTPHQEPTFSTSTTTSSKRLKWRKDEILLKFDAEKSLSGGLQQVRKKISLLQSKFQLAAKTNG